MMLSMRNTSRVLLLTSVMILLVTSTVHAQPRTDLTEVADSLIAAGSFSAASDTLREIYSANQSNYDALRKLANIAVKTGDFATANQAFSMLIEVDQADADSYLELARLSWLAGEFDVALQYVDMAEKVSSPIPAKAFAYRSIIYRGVGRVAEAESLLISAKAVYPNNPILLSNYGLVVALLRGPEEGFKWVDRAYGIDSLNVYTLSSYASLYLAQGDVEKARVAYERALAVEPENYFTLNSIKNLDKTAEEMKIPMLMQQGVSYFDRALYLKARASFKKVIELDSTFFEAYLNLGFTLNVLGEPRGAISAFEKANSLDSTSAALFIGWGNALAGISEFDEAIGMYEKAISIDSTISEVHDALRMVRELKRQSEEGD